MTNSPYQPPQVSSFENTDPARDSVRRVAKYQRFVIFSLIGNLFANGALFATSGQSLAISLVAIAFGLGVAICAMVSVFLLAKEVLNTAVGILFAILMLVPCLSLIVLLMVNQKATSFLQRHGVRVGFLGADPDRI